MPFFARITNVPLNR